MDCLHSRSQTRIFSCFKYVLSSSPPFSGQTLLNFNHFSYSFLLCMMDCLNGFLSSHIWKLTSEKYFRSKWKVLRSRDHGPFKLLRRGLAESRHSDHRRPQPCSCSPRPPSCGLVCVWSKCKCKDITHVGFVSIESYSYCVARFRLLKVDKILINCPGSGEAVLRQDQARLEEWSLGFLPTPPGSSWASLQHWKWKGHRGSDCRCCRFM